MRGDRQTAAALREGIAAEKARIGVLARGELGWELAALDRELAAGLA